MAVVALVSRAQRPRACSPAWLAVVLLTTILVIVRRILRHRYVTIQTIFGALERLPAHRFLLRRRVHRVAKLSTAPFFAGGQPVTPAAVQYFSFITLSTTGYGDYTAAGDAGRSMAVLEAVLGQIFLVTLVARLVALYGMARPVTAPPGGPTGTAAPSDAVDH